MKKVLFSEFKLLLDAARVKHEKSNEPIPEFKSKNVSEVKYILTVPFEYSFGKARYYGFYKRAAVLFYLLIKNHPLANGNKRMAVITLEFFYSKNKKELSFSNDELYELAYFVVNSRSEDYDSIVLKLTKKLKNNA